MFTIATGRGLEAPHVPQNQLEHSNISDQEPETEVERLKRDPRLMDRIGDAIRGLGYVGNVLPALLVYIAFTSRFLDNPINLNVVAPSSTGKSFTVDKPLELMPEEAYYYINAASPRALIYCEENFEHKVIIMAEADSIPEDGPAASAIRSLASDNVLSYDVVEKGENGRHVTRPIRKYGPTGLITTSTKSLGTQMGTRMLEVPLTDDASQTRNILLAQACRAEAPGFVESFDVGPFIQLQRELEAGEWSVVIPFAGHLAELVPTDNVRMRRDFKQLLTCIQAIALLHQFQRKRDSHGAIVATLDDYVIARDLLGPVFDAVTAEGLTPVIRQTVEAIKPSEYDVTLGTLAKRVGVSKSTASWRGKRAVEGGWLTNDEWRDGCPARFKRANPLPDETTSLPTVEQVRERGATCTK